MINGCFFSLYIFDWFVCERLTNVYFFSLFPYISTYLSLLALFFFLLQFISTILNEYLKNETLFFNAKKTVYFIIIVIIFFDSVFFSNILFLSSYTLKNIILLLLSLLSFLSDSFIHFQQQLQNDKLIWNNNLKLTTIFIIIWNWTFTLFIYFIFKKNKN